MDSAVSGVRRSIRLVARVGLVLGLVLAPVVARATTYYVDPGAGSDAADGKSVATAWKTPPGTRTVNDAGFLHGNWGNVGTGNRIGCGDTILLKGGATHTSAAGGAWRIDPTYYDTGSCSASNPITLQVATAAQWPGSSGPFVVDGGGITVTSVANPDYSGLVDVENVSWVTIAGAGASQRLEIRNAAQNPRGRTAGMQWNGNTATQPTGLHADWLSLHHNGGGGSGQGISIGFQQNFLVSNSVAFANTGPGFATGLLVDKKVTNAGFVDIEAYGNGTGGEVFYGDGLGFGGGESLWCVRCKTHDNVMRGINTGEVGGGYNMVYRFRDLEAWNNGTTTDNNVARTGIGASGDDKPDGITQQNFVVRGIFFGNPSDAAWMGYGAGRAEIWHAVFYRNGIGPLGWPSGDVRYDRSSDYAGVFNSIEQKGAATPQAWGYSNANVALDRPPVSHNNVYRPLAADSENFSQFSFQNGAFSTNGKSYADAAKGAAGFTGSDDKIGFAFDPKFVATNPNSYGPNDFHIRSGSAAVDAGRFFLRANGAGSSKSTITVKANGGSGDPRNYFIAPASYLQAQPDTIQIEGCGRVTIDAMTASTITFHPACSWSDGAGVHFPWTGSAPDSGRYELETGGSTPPSPPVLLSVDPIP